MKHENRQKHTKNRSTQDQYQWNFANPVQARYQAATRPRNRQTIYADSSPTESQIRKGTSRREVKKDLKQLKKKMVRQKKIINTLTLEDLEPK